MRTALSAVLTSVVLLLTQPGTVAGADGEARAVTYSPHVAHLDCHTNLGPTGAQAWLRGYHLVVATIDQGSPADGALRLGDVVTGAGGTLFGAEADPRMTLGNAIGAAEADGTPLQLSVVRDGVAREVALTLPKLGAYGPTWPTNCDKSARILDAACRALLDAQFPDGRLPTDGEMGTFLAGLLLLGSGDPEYLDGARRAAHYATTIDYAAMSTNNWPMGYGGLLMAEYYLATGDNTVLYKLAEVAEAIAAGQMLCGSWGHKSPAAGYGALNQPAIVCAITLVLAAECGVPVNQAVVRKALDFFGRYAELGSVPYGDNNPGRLPDDNGRCASAGILMHLAGREREADAFARSVAMSYWMREEGHTGGFFSLTWGPLGARLAGDRALQEFLDYQRWYYNLSRTWRGDLVMLPYFEALTRFDSSSYKYFAGEFTTGGLALAFTLPKRRLRITGAPPSPFAADAPIHGELRTARDCYVARQWERCDRILAGLGNEGGAAAQNRYVEQLKDARALARASADRTIVEIESNLVSRAPYRASEQFEALLRSLGDAGDARFAALKKRFASGTVAWHVREGRAFYKVCADMKIRAVMSWVPQGLQARGLVEALPTLRMPIWEPLSPTSEVTPQPWRTLLVDEGGELPEGWELPGFEDGGWKSGDGIVTGPASANPDEHPKGPVAARREFTVDDPKGVALRVRLQTVRKAHTRVFLNGRMVVDAVRGQRGGYASIALDDSALTLLSPGRNLLAVSSTGQGKANTRLDVGLEISRTRTEQRVLPVRRVEQLVLGDQPQPDDVLRIREPKDRMQKLLQETYDAKGVAALVEDLRSPVAYRRRLAENALVNQGAEAMNRAFELADDPDWRVRSGLCNVVEKAVARQRKIPDAAVLAAAKAQVPMLTRLLDDPHFWVRTRAAWAFAGLGEAAAPAVEKLAERTGDPEEWVRYASMSVIRRLEPEPELLLAAARSALLAPSSSFDAPRNALAVFEKHTDDRPGQLEALLTLLRNPPEGGGGSSLANAITLAAAADPEGTAVVPVLIEAAADRSTRYRRQRGNPRRKAIDTLGNYGPKAAGALPTLHAILRSEDKGDAAQHETARKAIAAITGQEPEDGPGE